MIRVLLSAPLCLHIRLSSRFTCWPEIWIVPRLPSAHHSDGTRPDYTWGKAFLRHIENVEHYVNNWELVKAFLGCEAS